MNEPSIDTDTVIVGAGAAGLAAASELVANGHHCMLVEARARIGGRIFTERHAGRAGMPVELGAEFIHGESKAILDRLDASGGVALDAGRERWVVQGRRLRRAEGQFDELQRRFRRLPAPQPDISFEEFLRRHRRAVPEAVRQIACSMVEGFDAADTSRISAREVLDEWSGPAAANSPTFRPAGGYDALLQSMRDTLRPDGAALRFDTVVRSIDWRKGHVDIEALDRGDILRIRAARAILTLPLGVLQLPAAAPGHVRFTPELRSKRSALAHLATGPVIRVVLRFSRPFWAELDSCRYRDAGFFFTPKSSFPTFWTSLPARTATLVAWSAGPNAARMAGLREKELFAHIQASLRALFGQRDYRLRLESMLWHDWQSDPYARGAYSYVMTGGARARHALAKPIDDTLYFAGEACDTTGEAGTVGGALTSGVAAARQVLDSLKPSRRGGARARN